MSVKPTPEATQLVFQLMTGHIVASAMNIAAQLGLADRVAKGPRSVADLARETSVNEDALYRMMRALASLGVFQETSPRVFGSTPAAAVLEEGPGRWMA